MKRLAALLFCAVAPAQDWYIAHVPDVQWYTTDPAWMPHYTNMTGQMVWWAPRPTYVAQVGDFTQTAAAIEYQRSVGAMRQLDLAGIPWGVSIGNHDYEAPMSAIPCDGPCITNWTATLGPTNHYRIVQTPEGPVMFLHLEWMPRNYWLQQAMAWMDQNPMPTVLVTHMFLSRPIGTASGGDYPTGVISEEVTAVPTSNNPRWVWEHLIQHYPQVFLVLNGHGYAIVRHQEQTILGREVQLHAFNLQSDPYGGNGFVRLVRFRGRLLTLYTFSTSYAGYGPNRTSLVDVIMPRSVAEIAAEPQPQRFQATADTYVFPFWGGGSTRGADVLVRSSQQGEHALFAFPAAPQATRAVLTVHVDGYLTLGDGVTIHAMLRPWSEGDSWNSLGGLVAGRDYDAAPVASLPTPRRGPNSIEFTSAIRTATGFGWVARPLGTRPTGWRSRERGELVERPALTVR